MPELVFENIRKEFPGGVTAVDDFSLTIPEPTMAVLVGPSGCGKTTLLRLVAGLETPTGGRILLGGERLDTRLPRERDVAMVFQSYALYPHMTVEQNLGFGLKIRKFPRQAVVERVREVARTLEIEALLARKPAELSGGQRQRVALGRAIVREPKVFLFDEPLSNLDARLRTEMRATIKKLYERLGVTSIYVTHDQVEAMTIGERLVVMNEGRVHQVGSPAECYDSPADTFVASFLGSPPMNLVDGRAVVGGDTDVTVGFRPEDILAAPPGHGHDAIELAGEVVLREPLGHETLTHIRFGPSELVARGKGEFTGGGGRTPFYVERSRLHLFSRDGRRITAV